MHDRGATVVETAILFPLVIIMTMASLQAAFYFLARATAINAAQAGVNAERGYGTATGSGRERALEFLAQTPAWLVAPRVTVTRDGQSATVTVTGRFRSPLPWTNWTITQSAHAPLERANP